MKRNEFIRRGLLGGLGLATGTGLLAAHEGAGKDGGAFSMKFSPDFGLFSPAAGKDPVDQLRWGYDHGFRAWECTWLRRMEVAEQERIARTMQQLGMEFGQFVGTTESLREVSFAGRNTEVREQTLRELRESVEVAKRMGTRFVHNVLGKADPNLPWDFQMANAIELLKRAAEIYEPHGITMVMETMNRFNHTGFFLHSVPQAYALAKAVGSPSVKLLFDVYHVQIEEGNLIPTMDYAWDEIAYFQLGDTPGRNEPGTGEINYVNLLKHIRSKGYRGFLGLEHEASQEGEAGSGLVVDAYRRIDGKV